jgi:molybdopterin-guanine dinucleotide biosynthesis protein A
MGSPKAWLPVHGETLLARTVRIVSEVASPIIVAAAAGQELPPVEAIIVRDAVADRGPLGGMAAALEAIDADAAIVVACDLPRLTVDVLRAILESRDDSPACVPVVDGESQPLAALFRKEVLPIVQRHLAMDRLSMRALLEAISVKWIHGLDPAALANANTPADHEGLLRTSNFELRTSN